MVYTLGVEERPNTKEEDVKMKKRKLSPVELKKVVELRRLGAKWTEIERETKVERRVAKRAYEEWERDKKMKEQEAARFRVAAEAFHEHLDDLIQSAESLVGAIHVPKMLRWLDYGDEVLERLWMRNIQGELEPFPTSSDEIERLTRRNKMLFKSLQDHTRQKVRWEALEEWKQSSNNAMECCKQLLSEAIKVITNILNNKTELKEKIKSATGGKDITEKLSDGLMETIWRGILTGKPDQLRAVKGASQLTAGQVWLEFYEGDSETRLYFNDEELAKEVLSECRWAVNNLREGDKSDLVQKLADEVRRMQARTGELEESLDELILCPMILRTRCDLCPA